MMNNMSGRVDDIFLKGPAQARQSVI